MGMRTFIVAAVVAVVGAGAHAAEPEKASVKYPADYRTWTHAKSTVIYSDKHPLYGSFGGIHHIYVNGVGLKSAKTSGPYPDGTVFVFDLLQLTDDNGAYIEGNRKLLAVMQKDAKRFKDTGGWGFEAFKNGKPQERLVTDATGQCFSCHTSQKEHDFVFSVYRE